LNSAFSGFENDLEHHAIQQDGKAGPVVSPSALKEGEADYQRKISVLVLAGMGNRYEQLGQ